MNHPNEQFSFDQINQVKPFKTQLLKWIGNKQRMAGEIISNFPQFNTYHEPFLGSGGVLGVLSPKRAFASDAFKPLMEIWECLHEDKIKLVKWYSERQELVAKLGKKEAYEKVLANYNRNPNGADFVFLSRSCYGGVVRFRKEDGYMSTPCGAHDPISPTSFASRVEEWQERTKGTTFRHLGYEEAMLEAKKGDIIYCDPPYSDSQAILYGAQRFSLSHLLEIIQDCKNRGVYVALSIDGSKYSGKKICNLPIPDGLFEQEKFVNVGRSMLKRFQMDGQTLEDHIVADRLLLTY
jgi:DNA adenine methylase